LQEALRVLTIFGTRPVKKTLVLSTAFPAFLYLASCGQQSESVQTSREVTKQKPELEPVVAATNTTSLVETGRTKPAPLSPENEGSTSEQSPLTAAERAAEVDRIGKEFKRQMDLRVMHSGLGIGRRKFRQLADPKTGVKLQELKDLAIGLTESDALEYLGRPDTTTDDRWIYDENAGVHDVITDRFRGFSIIFSGGKVSDIKLLP